MNGIDDIRHGLILSLLAAILGIFWAGYLATFHNQLHSGFERQERLHRKAPHVTGVPHTHASETSLPTRPRKEIQKPHVHSGSLSKEAMRRLLRGHIHWMGVGILAAVVQLIAAATSLKSRWKKLLAWALGIGALAYPPAWILMGFRTVQMGPKGAENSVLWLFAPAAGLVLASLLVVIATLLLEAFHLQNRCGFLRRFFSR